MNEVGVTSHAVQRYRERVLGCPERERFDSTLRNRILEQIYWFKWRPLGGKKFLVKAGTHQFIVSANSVRTTARVPHEATEQRQTGVEAS
jgi:hypothetical protein